MSASASRRRPTREPVNYHEDTTSDGEEDSEAEYQPEPANTAPSRPKRQRGTTTAPAPTPGKRRSTRHSAESSHPTYHDISSDDFDIEDDNDFALEPQRPAKRRKITTPQRRQTRASATPAKSARSKPRRSKSKPKEKRKIQKRVLARPFKPRTKAKITKFAGPSDNVIPDWRSLPLQTLRDIFTYASQPTQDQTNTSRQNVTWLMRTARSCTAFAIPALEAYYQSWYPLTEHEPHYLQELLQMPPEKTYMNYRVKIRTLNIDVRRIAYSAQGRERFDLSALVRLTPRLQVLEIRNPIDTPPYRMAVVLQKWKYPKDLFSALDDGNVRLKAWRWSRDMIPDVEDTDIYTYMSLAHTSGAFRYLERLVICGFDVNDSSIAYPAGGDEESRVPRLAATISQLAHLKDLAFVSCDMIMENFLDHIPRNLERLELSNCLEVTSGMLIKYLTAGGVQLRELVLNHNSALDLTFLPQLKALCPRLEVLKMDLTYYSERITYNDAWAMYDSLLSEDDIPSWPSTLRHLDLVNLQKWNAEAAQNLFRSLVDGAADLLGLRHLVVQAHINIPWRDRAQFRDQWIERLNNVYLRRSEDPSPFMGSLKQFRMYSKAVAEGRAVTNTADLESEDEPEARRRLSHVRVTPAKPNSEPEIPTVEADASADPGPSTPTPAVSNRRSGRVRERIQSQTISNTGDESDSDDSDEWSGEREAFIQGFCDVVDIRIDNQRPREQQYTEANFLDSEASGDEDWHSGAELEDDGYAW